MRKSIAGFIAGVVFASTGVVWAASDAVHGRAYTMLPGQAVTYGGLTCTAYKGTTATNANLVCLRNDLRGYGVVVSQDSVIVAKRMGGTPKVLFKRANR